MWDLNSGLQRESLVSYHQANRDVPADQGRHHSLLRRQCIHSKGGFAPHYISLHLISHTQTQCKAVIFFTLTSAWTSTRYAFRTAPGLVAGNICHRKSVTTWPCTKAPCTKLIALSSSDVHTACSALCIESLLQSFTTSLALAAPESLGNFFRIILTLTTAAAQ